jgi:PEP-CTERM motif-containing protein
MVVTDMNRYLLLTLLLVASTAMATPIPSSKQKTNALGFYQHQPKSALHRYGTAPLVADTSNGVAPVDGDASPETSGTTPAIGPGHIAPTDKTQPQAPGPGKITAPVNKTPPPGRPEFCMTQRIGGPPVVQGGCAVKEPIKTIPEPGTYALLGAGLLALLWATHRRGRRRAPSVSPTIA